MHSVLLLEDNKSFGYVLSEYMQLKGYEVTWKETVSGAMAALSKQQFNLAILDVGLKQGSGYEVAAEIAAKQPELPFIFLTARDLKIDQLKGFKAGATDYVTKPIDEEVFLAKVQAILSYTNGSSTVVSSISWNVLSLDMALRKLAVAGKLTKLTEKEASLMQALLSKPNALVSRSKVLQRVWGSQDEFSRNSMDVYISRLRKLLEGTSIVIANVHGKGFVLKEHTEEDT